MRGRGAEAFLKQAVRRVVSAFPQVRRIVLFGSYASGKPTKDSDLDFLVVMPTRKRWSDRVRSLQALFPERPIPIDFVVRTPEEIRERLTSRSEEAFQMCQPRSVGRYYVGRLRFLVKFRT